MFDLLLNSCKVFRLKPWRTTSTHLWSLGSIFLFAVNSLNKSCEPQHRAVCSRGWHFTTQLSATVSLGSVIWWWSCILSSLTAMIPLSMQSSFLLHLRLQHVIYLIGMYLPIVMMPRCDVSVRVDAYGMRIA